MSNKVQLDATGLPDCEELADLWQRARKTGEDNALTREVGRTLMRHLGTFQDLAAQRQLQAQSRKAHAAREQADEAFNAPPPKGYEGIAMFEPHLSVPPEDLARYVKACESRTGWGRAIVEFRQHRYQPERIGYWVKRMKKSPREMTSVNGFAADLWLDIVSEVNGQRANAAEQHQTDAIEALNRREFIQNQNPFLEVE